MDKTIVDLSSITERSEEVQHIIDRMPSKFGFWISVIIALIFFLMGLFGWIIRYPDVVSGQIIVNSNSAPIKLIANGAGKLKLSNAKSMDQVREGQVIAYIENAANPSNVLSIDSLIRPYNPNTDEIMQLYEKLPKNFSLGDLNTKYYAFSSALQQFINYKNDHLYDKQGKSLTEILIEQRKAEDAAEKRILMAKNNAGYTHKFYLRDSTLFSRKVISESELDKSEMNYINAKDAYQSALVNLTNAKLQSRQTESKLQELGITKPEKEKELRIALISSYNDLSDNIESWRQRYLFIAPFDGKVQFLKFYNNNQFIQNGEPIFTIIPLQKELLGQVVVPAMGSGKIEKGQEVIVKLDNFPYNEYGSVTGIVSSISLSTTTVKTEKNETETYQILVNFPNRLKTNYGTTLSDKAEAKGTAEIITNDRRLIQRLFDNLKYAIKK